MKKAPKKISSKTDGTEYLFLIGRISGIVLFAILTGFFLGLGIEHYLLPAKGLFIVGGIVLGVATGFYQTYKEIIKMQDNDDGNI